MHHDNSALSQEKVFYDSKSNIVGITGDYQLLKNADKFYSLGITPNCPKNMSPKDLCEYWNQMNFGKKVLDALLDYNGTSLSEEKLKDLALKTCSRQTTNVLPSVLLVRKIF